MHYLISHTALSFLIYAGCSLSKEIVMYRLRDYLIRPLFKLLIQILTECYVITEIITANKRL